MNHLPDELLSAIFKYAIEDVNQLLVLQSVCKRFQQYVHIMVVFSALFFFLRKFIFNGRLSNNPYLWYYAFKNMYPKWANNIEYTHYKQPSLDWKRFLLRIHKQRTYISSKFILESILSKNADSTPPPTYKIEQPIMADIDPVTNTGIVAVSKSGFPSRHKILFYSYPSYKLLRKLHLQFTVDPELAWSCQIVGMQTLQINNEKVRLLAISLNQPRETTAEDDSDEEGEEQQRQTFWNNIVIYRLYDDGSTTCLGITSAYLFGRGSWFFSEMNEQQRQWLNIVSPDKDYSSNTKAFLMIFGLGPHHFEGLVQVVSFDIKANDILSDPSQIVYEWDGVDFSVSSQNKMSALASADANGNMTFSTHMVTMSFLEARVSCMVHLGHINELNHLIFTGNYHGEDLSVYDWRFGIKVGVLSGRKEGRTNSAHYWGLESAFAVTPPSVYDNTRYGPRLIAVGDCRDKFEIRVLDIAPLVKVKWNPLDNTPVAVDDEHSTPLGAFMMYEAWWDRKTTTLNQLAIDVYNGDVEKLPYTISSDDTVKIVHSLEAQVKYVAYINLHTWLCLLREDGILSIMDIESGEILATVNAGGVAEDVNIIGENEIIVARKLKLKRSILPL